MTVQRRKTERRKLAERLLREGKAYDEVNRALKQHRMQPYVKSALYAIRSAPKTERSWQEKALELMRQVAALVKPHGVEKVSLDLTSDPASVEWDQSEHVRFELL